VVWLVVFVVWGLVCCGGGVFGLFGGVGWCGFGLFLVCWCCLLFGGFFGFWGWGLLGWGGVFFGGVLFFGLVGVVVVFGGWVVLLCWGLGGVVLCWGGGLGYFVCFVGVGRGVFWVCWCGVVVGVVVLDFVNCLIDFR
jgi:hypothetical protein